MKHIFLIVCNFILVESIFIISTFAQWIQTNGPYGGEVNCFVISGTNFFTGTTSGIYLSTDKGISWRKAGLNDMPISSLATIGNYIFAGSNSYYGGVFLSNNNGINWTQINNGLTEKYVRSIAVIGTTLFAGTEYNGVFRSTNYGDSWVQVNNGLTTTNILTLTANGTYLFAGTTGGIFLSTNNGSSWIPINNDIQNKSIYSIVISGSNIFAATDSGVIRSTNNGSSWFFTNLQNIFVKALTISGDEIFAGTYGSGILRTSNNGVNWTSVNNGLSNLYIRAFIVSPTAEILAGTKDGIFYSSDYGLNWIDRNNGLTNKVIYALAISGNEVLAGTSNGIYLTTNSGTSWTETGLNNKHVYSFAVYGSNILAGSAGIFLSSDYGRTWINKLDYYNGYSVAIIYPKIFVGTSGSILRSSFSTSYWETIFNLPHVGEQINTFTIKDTILFAGSSMGKIYYSVNYGNNWQNITISSLHVYSIAFSDTFILVGTYDGIFRKGINENLLYWPKIAFKDTSVRTLIIRDNKVIAGTNKGVFLSTDNGTNWAPINDGLPNISVYCIAISNKNIFLGTYNDGVWRRPLTELTSIPQSPVSLPTDFKLYQNYPNPFNLTTTIQFDIPIASFVTLKVYNLLGQEVATLVNEYKPAGKYEVEFDGSKLASGIYFCRLTTENYFSMKKLLMLK